MGAGDDRDEGGAPRSRSRSARAGSADRARDRDRDRDRRRRRRRTTPAESGSGDGERRERRDKSRERRDRSRDRRDRDRSRDRRDRDRSRDRRDRDRSRDRRDRSRERKDKSRDRRDRSRDRRDKSRDRREKKSRDRGRGRSPMNVRSHPAVVGAPVVVLMDFETDSAAEVRVQLKTGQEGSINFINEATGSWNLNFVDHLQSHYVKQHNQQKLKVTGPPPEVVKPTSAAGESRTRYNADNPPPFKPHVMGKDRKKKTFMKEKAAFEEAWRQGLNPNPDGTANAFAQKH